MGRAYARKSGFASSIGLCAIALIGLSSCDTDKSGHGDPNGPVTSDDCGEFLSVYCNKYAACDPVGLRREFGDAAACVARRRLTSCTFLALPGSGWTSGQLRACTAQVNAWSSCYGNVLETGACDGPKGTLTDGTACEQDQQCAGWCKRTPVFMADGGYTDPACGVCFTSDAGTPPATCGDAAACSAPERCIYDNMGRATGCKLPGPQGTTCIAVSECDDGLFCKGSEGDGGAGVCSKPLAAGAPCSGTRDCDGVLGLRCIGGICDAPHFASLGGVCDGSGSLCEANTSCTYPNPRPPTGTCQPLADDGAPCDLLNGPYCRRGASCRGGICHLPGDAQCR